MPPPQVPLDEISEIRVATSAKFNAKFKINNAPGEIIDAVVAKILLAQPHQDMDFYELATAVFHAFEVDGIHRLAITRRMLWFRRQLESARNRLEWLRSRVEIGERLVPSLVDASFMQFVLRMLSYFDDGLTEAEIAQYWLEQHIRWFGDAYRETVTTLGAKMLDPVLQSLLARQDEWEIQLVQRLNPEGKVIATSAPVSVSDPGDTNASSVRTEVVGTIDPAEYRKLVRWKSVAPFDDRKKAIIVPAVMFTDFPGHDKHPVKGSLSYYLPPYNEFFLSTPNASDASLAAQFLNKFDIIH